VGDERPGRMGWLRRRCFKEAAKPSFAIVWLGEVGGGEQGRRGDGQTVWLWSEVEEEVAEDEGE